MNTISATRLRLVLVLAFASVISASFISPAFADRDNDKRQKARHGQRDHREWRGDRRPVYRHPYVYAQPVYVPPPVYYEPRQSAGITLFFPLDLRR